MHHTLHRTISILAISLITLLGLETLVYINNLYQASVYNQVNVYVGFSVALYLVLLFWLYFIFDLHYKAPVIEPKHLLDALWQRFKYFGNWGNLRHFQNFLILPGIVYWAAVVAIGIDFGHVRQQQFIALASALALVVSYTLFKEIFHTKTMPVHDKHFVILSYVKMYAAWLMYSASLGIVWYYCLPSYVFYAVTFFVTFALLYQAAFQFSALRGRAVLQMLGISVLLTVVSAAVYAFWNINYYSAGLLMAGLYNFCWSMFFHAVKKSFSREALLEQGVILALVLVVVFGVTNFHARIERCLPNW